MTAETINVCGVLLHAAPGRAEDIRCVLEHMPGVEVHAVTEDHRRVVVCEQVPDGPSMADTVTGLDKVDGVLNVSLVYQHHEPEAA